MGFGVRRVTQVSFCIRYAFSAIIRIVLLAGMVFVFWKAPLRFFPI